MYRDIVMPASSESLSNDFWRCGPEPRCLKNRTLNGGIVIRPPQPVNTARTFYRRRDSRLAEQAKKPTLLVPLMKSRAEYSEMPGTGQCLVSRSAHGIVPCSN